LFGSPGFWEFQHVNSGPGVAKNEGRCEGWWVGVPGGESGQAQDVPSTSGHGYRCGAALILHVCTHTSNHQTIDEKSDNLMFIVHQKCAVYFKM
jgi:hypothetical protein